MNNKEVDVSVMIHNLPVILTPGHIVVRRSEDTGELWYYGNFGDDKDRANDAAIEIKNGIVLYVQKGEEE